MLCLVQQILDANVSELDIALEDQHSRDAEKAHSHQKSGDSLLQSSLLLLVVVVVVVFGGGSGRWWAVVVD